MRRSVLALATVLAASLALPSGAAAKPQITDPTGDQLPVGSAGYDVVSALFSTSGTTARYGRRTVYTPTKLVVTVTYAAAVSTDQQATQVVQFDAPGCADVYLQRFAGGTFGSADCLEDPFDFTVKASGKTLVFTLPFGVIGKSTMKKGAVLDNLSTYTALADPVLGYETAELSQGVVAVDTATTSAAYKIA